MFYGWGLPVVLSFPCGTSRLLDSLAPAAKRNSFHTERDLYTTDTDTTIYSIHTKKNAIHAKTFKEKLNSYKKETQLI
jgi:hypothetical protein